MIAKDRTSRCLRDVVKCKSRSQQAKMFYYLCTAEDQCVSVARGSSLIGIRVVVHVGRQASCATDTLSYIACCSLTYESPFCPLVSLIIFVHIIQYHCHSPAVNHHQ